MIKVLEEILCSLNYAPSKCTRQPGECTRFHKKRSSFAPPCPTTERLRMKAVNCHGLPHFAKSVVKRGRWY